ncbi:hypothetical protein NYQ35_16150 [Curtobacterium flaccumfaciens pv. flaccumfaciens]|uniref:hypothetical protein n=1 Tax=Curtobacterium flaccumfaciens TaxID=2035 RepID=UPI00217CD100|nr:hypothetical protein [Curtobacterium flaccumfaciens]MCS6570339.1 hypothetical protein [Curtobacterium flaccumfaciens pv. flaccumfaciens]MCS6585195.1 hypothetical protein [Curtobacterium flaccumfaciens pv. flaccumfaciens]
MQNGTGVVGVHLLSWFATATSTASAPDWWGWLSGTLSVSDIISGSGLALIVGLFATRKIITIGDHRARVADLEKFYEARIAEKDARYEELRESKSYWREAHNEQRARAEKAEDGVREFADEYAKLSNHLLGSIEQAAGGPS